MAIIGGLIGVRLRPLSWAILLGTVLLQAGCDAKPASVPELVWGIHGPYAADVTNHYIRWGSSPRGVQTLVLGAKVRALLDGRYNVSFEDLRRVYLPGLRHRVLLNFEAQAEGIDPDDVLLRVLESVPEKAEKQTTAVA
ncbi:MAG: hypothetical protein JO161_06680 [Planctomycetaceae bacterium]|nr:hypothetical protein [Planctomycetaceae bacterium]